VKREKRVPKPKAVDNGFTHTEQTYYPSRQPKPTPSTETTEWFYPGRNGQKVLQEKYVIEKRVDDIPKPKSKSRSEIQPGAEYYPSNNNINVPPKQHAWKLHEDYRPYNYLLNDRVDPTHGFGHDNINHSPIGRRKIVSQPQPVKVPTKQPTKQILQQPTNYQEKRFVQSRPPQPIPKKEKPTQVFYPSRRKPPQEIEDVNWFQPTPLPGLAKSPYTANHTVPGTSDYYDYRESNFHPNRPKKVQGFNYGLNQDNILHELKLKKTGRLQELLVK